MPKLQINDDGTITFPVAGEKVAVVLDEPTMAQMGELTMLAQEADAELTSLDTIDPETATFAQKTAWAEQVNARSLEIFGDKSPHGQRMIAVVKMLSGVDVTEDELYAWAMSPRTLRTVLEHFRSPLPGADQPPT